MATFYQISNTKSTYAANELCKNAKKRQPSVKIRRVSVPASVQAFTKAAMSAITSARTWDGVTYSVASRRPWVGIIRWFRPS